MRPDAGQIGPARDSEKHRRDRTGLLGCAAFALLLLVLLTHLALSSSAARIVLASLLLAAMAVATSLRWNVMAAQRTFRRTHSVAGRDLLLVYSASPLWQPYIEAEWLPRWGERAIVLNRSAPNWMARPEAELWSRMTAVGDHTPAAIVIPARGRVRVFRFFKAFRDYKHGNAAPLRALEADLEAALNRPT